MRYTFGEVPKLAEGTPLERVQVVNSGARVQIPPSPLDYNIEKDLKKSKKVVDKTVTTRYYNQADCETQAIKNKIKKLLTSTWKFDIIDELLTATKTKRTLKTEQ